MLNWLHIGDLHLSRAGGQNHRDVQRIVALVSKLPPGSLDFALLPGDHADDGSAEQFALVREAVAALRLPLHILPGDHDFATGSLGAFYRELGAQRLPYAATVNGYCCLFLDVVSAGTGGADFRLDGAQLDWAEAQVHQADRVAIFMHTYPADLREGAERLGALLASPKVLCVDMGHTHYNELANDGGTIFMATRSTGQIEEGPPGFSIAALDHGSVSWRFKPLDTAWPFVLVTCPVDRRIATGSNETAGGALVVRAKVLGDVPIETVEVKLGNGDWAPMTPVETTVWQARRNETAGTIRVRARDANGRTDEDAVDPAIPGVPPPRRTADGSDADRVGAWPEKGVLGTQLGPNRNGRAW
jgi:Icc protein